MELIAMVRMLDGIVQAHPKVVVMNQMSTKIESHNDQRMQQGSERAPGMVHPALGETWASVCTHRIRLYNHGNGQRSARLFKSPSIQEQCVKFQIVSGGISDVGNTLPQVVSIPGDEDGELGPDLEENIFHWEPTDLL
ncbi:DNA repair protein rad51c [Entomortierella chlamydospora]|nr:DNA repair protein rad51c [Entomortierella chlamydospora]